MVMKATAQNMMKDGAGALASTERALELLRELAAADPKNVEAQKDLAFAYGEQARALVHLGRLDEARARVPPRDRDPRAAVGERSLERGRPAGSEEAVGGSWPRCHPERESRDLGGRGAMLMPVAPPAQVPRLRSG